MKLHHAAHQALRGLSAHPTWLGLALLGIAIGVAAVVSIASLGESARALVVGEIEGLGAETVVVRPGREPKGLADIPDLLLTQSLTMQDVAALQRRENVPHLQDLMPTVFLPGLVARKTESFRAHVFGGDANFFKKALSLEVKEGVVFSKEEIRAKRRVAVIGSRVRDELFGGAQAVGKRITVGGVKFRVVGVFAPAGQVAFFDVDRAVVVPYTAAQAYITGTRYFNEIALRFKSPEYVARGVRDVAATLRERHRLGPNDEPDFNIVTQQALVRQVATIVDALTVFLIAVVAVALVVGGIGIMNIMLVSVTERTREVGVRKAVGATDRDILLQFLLEALLLTVAGGIAGVVGALGLSYLAARAVARFTALDWPFVVPWGTVLLAVFVAGMIGLVFGLYPAWKAARKDPVAALRHE